MFGQFCQVSRDHFDSSVNRVCAVQHPPLLPRWNVCGERTYHRAGVVLWRHSGIWSAGEYIRITVFTAGFILSLLETAFVDSTYLILNAAAMA